MAFITKHSTLVTISILTVAIVAYLLQIDERFIVSCKRLTLSSRVSESEEAW